MARRIPIQNIYYMLLYAWNRLPEGSNINVSGVVSPDLPNLLSKVLLEGTRHVLRRGLDRGYIAKDEDSNRPRGRIQLTDTMKRGLLSRAMVACSIDELSHNVLQNRIVKTTLDHLSRTENVDAKLREALVATLGSFSDVASIEITARDFGRIELHGNNAFYGFLLRVCELVYIALMPAPGENRFRFRDVLTEPQIMGLIFQDFIRNFYKLEQDIFSVKADSFVWPMSAIGHGQYLMPSMNTDVSLHNDNRCILIECKWTGSTFQYSHGVKSLRSEHLYQLYAYVRNHPRSSTDPTAVEGLLLYPQVDDAVDVSVSLEGHNMRARTLDLQCDWPQIKDQLMAIIEQGQAA
jgi:5-methylcytosine-specific restriction enzyme subunit McrC